MKKLLFLPEFIGYLPNKDRDKPVETKINKKDGSTILDHSFLRAKRDQL